MLRISAESLAPALFAARRELHRYDAAGRVPELVYCLFLCKAVRRHASVEEITAQAILTYPQYFYTWVNDDEVPDLAVVMLNLEQATEEKLVVGDWQAGWRLRQRGLRLAKDIDRRRRANIKSH
jgi:hypothetical protein